MRLAPVIAMTLGLAAAGAELPAAAAVMPGERPPASAMKLSEVLLRIENTITNFGGFKEVNWNKRGYWEVEFWTTTGEEVEANVDPGTATVVLE